MASAQRIEQINVEIHRVLADRLRTLKDPRVSGLCSIVRVDTSNDLSLCRVYVSSLGGGDEVEKGLKSASGYLRRELGQAVGLRHVPALQFILDHSLEEGARILDLIEKTKKEENEEKP